MHRRRFLVTSTAASAGLILGLDRPAQAAKTLRLLTPEADPGQIKAWNAVFEDFGAKQKDVTVKGEFAKWDDIHPACMPILYDQPSDVGADRIVNGVAAYERFGRGANRPVVVVDFGTATTFDAISARGEYLGGAICPGVQISADALFRRAARLPRIDVRKPPGVIGRTTIGAMQSGLFWGYVGMVEGLVRRMDAELGGGSISVATGGLAETIAPETTLIHHVDPDLTLQGLRIVWERNQ